MGLLRRPLRPEDEAAWAALAQALAEADGDDDMSTEGPLRESFTDPYRDYPRGSIAIFDSAVLAGFGVLCARPAASPAHDMRFYARVHPGYRGRGLGGELLSWAEATAPVLHSQRHPGRPLTVGGDCLASNAAAIALYSTRGYAPVHRTHTMVRDLSAIPAPVPPPDGVTISRYTPDRLLDALDVRNEAFRDHFDSTRTSEQAWRHKHAEASTFRPEHSFVADDGGTMIGVLLCHEYKVRPQAPDLHLVLGAVRAAGRRRGITSALLAAVLRSARAGGYRTASSYVDADSLTGAVIVIERAGFAVAKTWVSYRKPLTPQ